MKAKQTACNTCTHNVYIANSSPFSIFVNYFGYSVNKNLKKTLHVRVYRMTSKQKNRENVFVNIVREYTYTLIHHMW